VGRKLTGLFRDRLAMRGLPESERSELAERLARMAKTKSIQDLLAERLQEKKAGRDEKQVVLWAMARTVLKPVPARWITALLEVLQGSDELLVREAVTTARSLPVTPEHAGKLSVALLALAGNPGAAVELRLGALAAVPGGLAEMKPEAFAFLQGRLDRELPIVQRSLAADVLSRAKLTQAQLLQLTGTFAKVGPMELEKLLDAFGRSKDDVVGLKLLAALERSPVRSSLRVASLRARLAKYGAKVQAAAEGLYARLDADLARQKEQLETLLGQIKGGDARRGQAVFNSTKGACASCHAIGYLGGKVGPDLTRIGQIRSDRDLLEAILFPSASFVRSYEPVLVTTTRGKQHNGLVRKDSPEEVVLVTGATEEVRIPRRDIESMEPSKVSIMPAGLDKVLTTQELADLVAFLQACK
jgi:putative heme-binding domain-containing protein